MKILNVVLNLILTGEEGTGKRHVLGESMWNEGQ